MHEYHIDGDWNTSKYYYKGHEILIKSKPMHGMKAHAFDKDGQKVLFTLRYKFIKPESLLEKVKTKLDKL